MNLPLVIVEDNLEDTDEKVGVLIYTFMRLPILATRSPPLMLVVMIIECHRSNGSCNQIAVKSLPIRSFPLQLLIKVKIRKQNAYEDNDSVWIGFSCYSCRSTVRGSL
jgi:hypothetical protein